MSYQALYRKYRPATFQEVIGQEHIIKTLTNQIRNDKIGHAYLFTGTRGIGKTTIARIFAKAINCQSKEGILPCNKCSTCLSLDKGSIDIIELDGASNNRVDEAREIKENAIFPPVQGKYKVYIIDEVHMLTNNAFNALLKTIEEPPEHVVFILCTTEVHKIPQTILSRCMRFDFWMVSESQIEKLIYKLLEDIEKKAEETAVHLIASLAEGSVRDALSYLDRCILSSNDCLTYEDALSALGATDLRQIYALGNAILVGNAKKIISIVEELSKAGKNFSVLSREVAMFFRNIVIVKMDEKANEILKLPQKHFELLLEYQNNADIKKALLSAEAFGKIEGELKYALSPTIMFETLALKMCFDVTNMDFVQFEKRLKTVENLLKSNVNSIKSNDNEDLKKK